MQTIMQVYAWVVAHPFECVQYLALFLAVANVLWAQWPKPKSDKAQAIWKAVHHALQLVVTSAGAKGTFTWPSLIRAVLNSLLKGPDPFDTPADPAPVAAPEPSGAKDGGKGNAPE